MASRKSLNTSLNASGNSGKRIYVIAYDGYHIESGGVLTNEEKHALDRAYELLTANGASVGKTTIQKILNLTKNSPGISYIVPRFDGIVFEKLEQLEARIYGPLAITAALESVERKIYLWDGPLLCPSLKGMLITCTGLAVDERRRLATMIKHMGGVFSGSMSDTTTHLVALECNPTSEKYRLARKFKLPVVTPEWINVMYQGALRGELMDAKEMVDLYLVPLFRNCVATCSGVSHEERLKISKLFEHHGGVFGGEMNRESCTHLLTNSNTGTKYKKATEWGTVHIVVVRWLSSCLAQGYRLPEQKYFPGHKTSTQANDATNATLGGSGLSASTITPVNSSLNMSAASSIVRNGPPKTNLVSAIVNPLKVPSNRSFRRQSSMVAAPKVVDPVLGADLSQLKDNYGQYLKDCRLYFFDVPDKDVKVYTFLANSTGCNLVAEINFDDDTRTHIPHPTHIIVPSNATLHRNKIETLRKAIDYDVDVVRGEWLLDCVQEKAFLDSTSEKYIHPAVKTEVEENQPPAKLQTSAAGAFMLTMPETRKIQRRSTGFGIDTTKGSSLMNSPEDMRFGMAFNDSSSSSRGLLKSGANSSLKQLESRPSSSKDLNARPNATSTQRVSHHSPIDHPNVSDVQPEEANPFPVDSFDATFPMPQATPVFPKPSTSTNHEVPAKRKSILKNTQPVQSKEPSFTSTPTGPRVNQPHPLSQIRGKNPAMPTLSPTPFKPQSIGRQSTTTSNDVSKSVTVKGATTVPSQGSEDAETQPFFQGRLFGVEVLPSSSQQQLVVGEIERLGGQVVSINNIVEPVEVDFLLAPSLDFEADKYPNVYYHNLTTVFWLQYCSDSAKECPINEHPLFKPFGPVHDRSILKGIVAAVSGSNMRIEKTLFGSLVEEMGGIHQPAMSRADTGKLKRTTHVIALGASSRLKDVSKWENVRIVDGSWLIECIARGRRLPEEDYPFDEKLFKHYSGRSDPVWMQNSNRRRRSRSVIDETADILPETMALPRSIFCQQPEEEEEEAPGAVNTLFTHDNNSSSPSISSAGTGTDRLNLSAPMEEYISGKRPYRLKIFDNPVTPKASKASKAEDIAKIFSYDDTESNASVLGALPDDSTAGESFVANQMKKMVRNFCNDTAEFEQFYEKNQPKEKDWHDLSIYKKAAYETGPREIPDARKLASPGLYSRPFPTGPKTPAHLARAPMVFAFEDDDRDDSTLEAEQGNQPEIRVATTTAPMALNFEHPMDAVEAVPTEPPAPEPTAEPVQKPVEAEPQSTEQPGPSVPPAPQQPQGCDAPTAPAPSPVEVASEPAERPDPPAPKTSKPADPPAPSRAQYDLDLKYQARISSATRMLDELSKKCRKSSDIPSQADSDSSEEDPFIASAKQNAEMAKRTDFAEDQRASRKPLGPRPDYPVVMGWAKGISTQELMPADLNKVHANVDEHFFDPDSNDPAPVPLRNFKVPTSTSLESMFKPKKKKSKEPFVDKAKEWLLAGEKEYYEKMASEKSTKETDATVPGPSGSAEKPKDTVTTVEASSKNVTSNEGAKNAGDANPVNAKATTSAGDAPEVRQNPDAATERGPTSSNGPDDSFDITWNFEVNTQTDILPRAVAEMKIPNSLDDHSEASLRTEDVLSALKVPPPRKGVDSNQTTKQLPPLADVPEEHSFNPGSQAWKEPMAPPPPPVAAEPEPTTSMESEHPRDTNQRNQRRRPISQVAPNEKSVSPVAKRQKASPSPTATIPSTSESSKKAPVISEPSRMTTRRTSKTLNISVNSSSKPSNLDDTLTSLESSNPFIHKRFMLSGVALEERQNIMQQIRMLSGTILEQASEFQIAQVILCTKPARTQKLLSAIAAGKVICHTSYVIASARKGEWLDEEEYEFGNPKSYRHIRVQDLSPLAKQVAEAGFRWRKNIAMSGHGAFYGWKVVLFMPQNRAEALAEVIKCGGGEAELSTCISNSRTLKTFTHVIIKDLEPSRPQLTILGKEGIPFYTDNLLSEYLIGAVPEKALAKYHPCHLEFH